MSRWKIFRIYYLDGSLIPNKARLQSTAFVIKECGFGFQPASFLWTVFGYAGFNRGSDYLSINVGAHRKLRSYFSETP